MLQTIHNCLGLGLILWYNLWLRNGQVTGSCVCDNEPSGCIICGEFLD